MPPRPPQGEPFSRWGPNVTDRRTALGLSQAEIAERADISKKHLSQIESGNSYPGYDVQTRLARALDTSVTELFPRSDDEAELVVLAARLGNGCS